MSTSFRTPPALPPYPTITSRPPIPSGYVEGDAQDIIRTPLRDRAYWDTKEEIWFRMEPEDPQLEPNDQLRIELGKRVFSLSKKPKESAPRFFLNEVSVSTPGNLTSIGAQVKAGKSAFVGAMIASALVDAGSDSDCLGWTSENPNNWALVHFDTEQSPLDHWQLIDRARRRANISRVPEWLRSYCLTGFAPEKIRNAISLALDDTAQKFGGVHSFIIDGLADAIADVNDAAKANEFISELHELAIRYDCPIIGVIHFNPGTEKTRGHLGSQFERKAETNLRLQKSEEITEVWSDKQRRAPIPRDTGPSFTWSSDEEMHVSAENPAKALAEAKAQAKREAERLDAEVVFAQESKALSFTEILNLMIEKLALKRSGARRRLENWVKQHIVEKNEANQYVLS